MYSKTVVFLVTICLIISLSNAKNLMVDDHRFEISAENASIFLRTSNHDEHTGGIHKREIGGKDCIPCKLGLNPCCKPNICVKKTFWFDECMEIKQR